MKTNILERYSRMADGSYLIDITAGKISDLYDDFDRHTPYVRKELDQNLVEYITESASDLGEEAFAIQFHFLELPEEEMRARITASINNYFLYLKNIEIRELSRVIRISLIYFVIGVFLLFLSVWVNENLALDATVLGKVFAEGLTVAAWVSLWQALATFLVNWTPYTRQIKLYERIAGVPVQFTSHPAKQETAASIIKLEEIR